MGARPADLGGLLQVQPDRRRRHGSDQHPVRTLCHDDTTQPYASNPFCAQIQRDPTGTNGGAVPGGVVQVLLVNQNVASTKVEGWTTRSPTASRPKTCSTRTTAPSRSPGRDLDVPVRRQGLPCQAYTQFANTITNATPEWKANGSVRWTYDKYSFTWSTIYFGSMIASQAQQAGVLDPYKTGDYFRHDIRRPTS